MLDFPAAVGAGLFGSICDAWEVPITDVGPEGDDRGKGGRYLLIPANVEPWWPDTRWGLPVGAGPKTAFTFLAGDRYEIDDRGQTFFLAYAVPKKLGAATVYVGAFVDAKDAPLQGDKIYRLQIPANVPANQYWAVTVYALETAAFIREAPKVTVDSYQNTQKNADGSIDVYFGPVAPAGKESNWIYTAPGKRWFTLFRFYGPEKALFDKTWKLPDIEQVK